ncbi:hypothetical protein [Pseudorhizobium flavum]|uniref:Uncharacterized protein n=1 Tax=Pseudorhizobium flavum TaxID=1335061 RepID=A0A7W9YUE4_9HYPH|nr:hypothetical protein [Pseudorhizobium flavum]MBB6178573.1 hypothetical protein [Pseudorhizobium flavum]
MGDAALAAAIKSGTLSPEAVPWSKEVLGVGTTVGKIDEVRQALELQAAIVANPPEEDEAVTEEGEAGETAEGDDVATDGTGEEAVVEEAEELSSDEDPDVAADASTYSGTAPSTEAVALPL